jgi:hypothetical protein
MNGEREREMRSTFLSEKRRWDDDTNMNIKEMGCEAVKLAPDKAP